MKLNHTIVPAHDRQASARFYADMFGVPIASPMGPFVPVQIDQVTFDFAERQSFEPHHYAFEVSDAEFDSVLTRVKEAGLEYSSDPHHQDLGHINHRKGGRGFYFFDPNGHNIELLTKS